MPYSKYLMPVALLAALLAPMLIYPQNLVDSPVFIDFPKVKRCENVKVFPFHQTANFFHHICIRHFHTTVGVGTLIVEDGKSHFVVKIEEVCDLRVFFTHSVISR